MTAIIPRNVTCIVIEQGRNRVANVPKWRIKKNLSRRVPRSRVRLEITNDLETDGEAVIVIARNTLEKAKRALERHQDAISCIYVKRVSVYSLGPDATEMARNIPIILNAVVSHAGLICLVIGNVILFLNYFYDITLQ